MFDPVIIRFEADPFILPLILTLMGQLHYQVSCAFFLAAPLGLLEARSYGARSESICPYTQR